MPPQRGNWYKTTEELPSLDTRHVVDEGEAEAIELAKELQADWLLIDERKGRRLASQERVPVIGLLGVVLIERDAT